MGEVKYTGHPSGAMLLRAGELEGGIRRGGAGAAGVGEQVRGGGGAAAWQRDPAAKDAGVKRILYTSHQTANVSSAFVPGRDHAATEALLEACGVP